MGRHVVARAAELPPGGRLLVEVEGRSIGIFNVDGELYALRNRCPHQGGPLCTGRVSRSLVSHTPGEYIWGEGTPTLRCPWHNWEFDLRTGRSWFDPERTRVRAYPVAETYAVERDEDLVVVEV